MPPRLAAVSRGAATLSAPDHGIRHVEVCTDEDERPEYVANDGDRCYHCKSALFDALAPLADLLDARVALATNLDDLGDHRPGLRAARERGAVSPLVDAGFTKAAVREASDLLGLETAEKPAAACLASRVAYGDQVTPEVLRQIDRAEAGVHALGFRECRVRAHGDGTVARLEVPLDDIPRALDRREPLRQALFDAGFLFASLDLGGLSSGGMNVLLRSPRRKVSDLGFARVDIGRELRQGIPEAVYAPGKTVDEIVAIVGELREHNEGPVLVTRIDDADAAEVGARVPGGHHRPEARLLSWNPATTSTFRVAVVSGGTADGPVTAEAAAVAETIGLEVTVRSDVGVAGLQRLLSVGDELDRADAVVVVAGMEGALASAVGGLVSCPVVAVPTSTGYGASLEGVTALLAMHASCAPGLTVVNIDSGYGAAMAAYRLAHAARR